MKKNISEKVEDLLKTKISDNAQINQFIRANEEYEKLIHDGLTIKRGYNIMTTEEIYNPGLNCSYSQSNTQSHC
ncbi:MAG: hypothetical protein NTX61_12780 [Bacteroidetes bacterium]|nr:hypothetical protein [Bacteroidota bacterium]